MPNLAVGRLGQGEKSGGHSLARIGLSAPSEQRARWFERGMAGRPARLRHFQREQALRLEFAITAPFGEIGHGPGVTG